MVAAADPCLPGLLAVVVRRVGVRLRVVPSAPAPVLAPGLSVVTAPRLEPLFERLADAIAADPLPPLQRETILVAQNKGLRAWLTNALARAHGCAASLDLRAPLTFATDLARTLVPESRAPEGRHPFDAAPLAWRLAPILDVLGPEPVWDPLRAYLDRTGGQAMPLATRLAQLFDDYQVYRPDVLAAWAEGEDPAADFTHGAWQAALWRRLHADAPCLDRAESLQTLADALRQSDGEAVRRALPPRVSVFGALLFPPLYYRVLAEVARHVPVTLYAVTVGDGPHTDPHRHPLLRALAGRTADYWTVLADLDAPPPERLAADVGAVGDAAAPALRQLQAALAADVPPAAPVPLDSGDRSIRILDAHSPTRELEALRDALLDAFDTVEGLRPADVLVLVPDLPTYAPLVDAVFGAESATGDGLRLPYHVVDHPHAPALRVVEAFAKALRLHDGRVTASDLLDLLGYPLVRRAAGIDEGELPRLRQWVAEAGVCWGLDADRKARFGLPEDDLHTWRFGLDRLLLGVMTGDDAGLVLGHLPCDAVGLDGADLLGRFCEWAEALFRSLDALDHVRPLAEWPEHLLLFLDGVFAPEDDEEVEAVVFLRQAALDLATLGELADAPGAPVSFRTVRAHLDGATATFERREPVLTGRITVADPLVLRHAPHRVVAVLGLGDGVWPRPETPLAFDLLAHDPRPGDAAPRQMEKQLFVDAVLAARDRLILSTVGRSQKDNSSKAASVVLDAFRDAVRRHWGEDARRFEETHRLQPFDGVYFADGPLRSFAAHHHVRPEEAAEAAPFLTGEPLPDLEPQEEVSLAELADAWTNPSRYVVKRRLRVSLDLDEDAVRDDEPVALDGLGRYGVRQVVLAGVLDGLDDEAIAARLLRSGLLPGGAPGAAWLRQAREAVLPVAEAVRQWGPAEPLAVALDVEGGRVVGTVERTGPEGVLRYRPGSVRPKDLVGAWLDHLAVCAGRTATTTAVGTRDSCHFAPLPADDARMLLQGLVRGYRAIRQAVPPLFERASHTYADKMSKAQRQAWLDRILARERAAAGLGDGAHNGVPDINDWALKQAGRAFQGGFGRTGDREDAYVSLAVRGRDPFADDAKGVHAWAACLWAPLLTYHQPGLPS